MACGRVPSCSSAESFSEVSEADKSFEEVVIENASGTVLISRRRDDGTVDHVSQVGTYVTRLVNWCLFFVL